MTDSLPTTWRITPHTEAKHAILKRYLGAWFPILSNQAATIGRQLGGSSRRVLYVDGFAGPGEYDGGEPGSPVIAFRTAVQHVRSFPFPIEMLFVEQREDRYRRLCDVIEEETSRSTDDRVHIVPPRLGDCDQVLNDLLNEHNDKGTHFGPALAFLDQFGYGAVSMKLIRRILSIPQCEVFTYLDYRDMNRWITDPEKASAFDRAYGGNEWRDCIQLPESERRRCLLDRYKAALRDESRGKAKYVAAFLMFDEDGKPLYWLIFCTNNLRGLEEMKRAMWSVDKTGHFRFSDKDAPTQLSLLEMSYSQEWLAEELRHKLAGRTLTAAEIKEYVLVETPCYLFRKALKQLECTEKAVVPVRAPADRRPGTFRDPLLKDIELSFERPLFQ
jgi:three-Cys-motif partner protein